MTYVKKGALVLLVEDDQIAKYKANGFDVCTPPEPKKPAKAGGKDGKDAG